MQNCLNNKMSYATKMTFCPVDFVCFSFLTDHIWTPEYKIIYFHQKLRHKVFGFYTYSYNNTVRHTINFIEAAARGVFIHGHSKKKKEN